MSYFYKAHMTFISLTMMSRLNYNNFTITGDSLNVVNMLQGHSPPRWDNNFMIEARRIINGI